MFLISEKAKMFEERVKFREKSKKACKPTPTARLQF